VCARRYGRGVTDDKGPIIAFVFAVKQLLANAAAVRVPLCLMHARMPRFGIVCEAHGDLHVAQEGATPQLPVNIVMAIEGEEENDSKGFVSAIVRLANTSAASATAHSCHAWRSVLTCAHMLCVT
jgi:hypothetical protein